MSGRGRAQAWHRGLDRGIVAAEALRILDAEAPDAAGIARVLFTARVFERGKDRSFAECSEFRHDGATAAAAPARRYCSLRASPVSTQRTAATTKATPAAHSNC